MEKDKGEGRGQSERRLGRWERKGKLKGLDEEKEGVKKGRRERKKEEGGGGKGKRGGGERDVAMTTGGNRRDVGLQNRPSEQLPCPTIFAIEWDTSDPPPSRIVPAMCLLQMTLASGAE